MTEIKAHCSPGSSEDAIWMAKFSLILGVFSRLLQSWEREGRNLNKCSEAQGK